jgi:uracil-DNA glycosylase
MLLSECKECSLCKSRLHSSKSIGKYPASILIVFGREPVTEKQKLLESEFMRQINYEVQYDFLKTYAIKCYCKEKVTVENISKCRIWLKSEYKKVNPYLVILMGKIAVVSVLGEEFKDLRQNIFYIKSDKKFFVGESLMSNNMGNIQENLDRILCLIQKEYRP